MAIDREKQFKRQNEWIAKQDRINFIMPAGTKAKINAAASSEGISTAEWLRRIINAELNK